MRLVFAVLLAAGCGTDLFALPFDKPLDFGFPGDEDLSPSGDAAAADLHGGDDGGGSDGGDGGLPILPASCALLGCTPAMNEGDLDLQSGDISGCHAYDTLTISGVVQVSRSDGLGFAACAEHIVLGISLSADGRGYDEDTGPGKGGSCGSGGGHGGNGADATGCNGGGSYDDPNLPRQPGSGGGSFGGGGGRGGGAIELSADRVDIIGFVTANGQQGSGAVAGGGAGGSVLIHAGELFGTGQISARGGGGLGLGGGGGGGRVAVYATTKTGSISIEVGGGGSMSGSSGSPGTVVEP